MWDSDSDDSLIDRGRFGLLSSDEVEEVDDLSLSFHSPRTDVFSVISLSITQC